MWGFFPLWIFCSVRVKWPAYLKNLSRNGLRRSENTTKPIYPSNLSSRCSLYVVWITNSHLFGAFWPQNMPLCRFCSVPVKWPAYLKNHNQNGLSRSENTTKPIYPSHLRSRCSLYVVWITNPHKSGAFLPQNMHATVQILLCPCKVTGLSYKSQSKRAEPVGKYHKTHLPESLEVPM